MPIPMVFALKIDVDTERGTRIGVPQMAKLLRELEIPATFLFSLGPDNTGRALKRIFRPGFLKKVSRTSVVSTHGIRTLLNGVLWPGPHIAKRHADILRAVRNDGFEVGIHTYDHCKWQDGVFKMPLSEIQKELKKARDEFQGVFGTPALTAGAPGWQANEKTLAAYDEASLLYGSDCRGVFPFLPMINGHTFKTLQIPTTLPTLDELIGLPEHSFESLTEFYISLLKSNAPNVMTAHAELEGMKYLDWFKSFLIALKKLDVQFVTLKEIALNCLREPSIIPRSEMIQGEIKNRSGKLAIQVA